MAVAHVEGELDKLAADAVHSRLDMLLERGRLVVDLSGVTFLDSAGLHALFGLGRAATERGGRVALAVAPGSAAARVVELAHLAGVMPVCATVGDAVARVGDVS